MAKFVRICRKKRFCSLCRLADIYYAGKSGLAAAEP
jgi:hypothetical protein